MDFAIILCELLFNLLLCCYSVVLTIIVVLFKANELDWECFLRDNSTFICSKDCSALGKELSGMHGAAQVVSVELLLDHFKESWCPCAVTK